MRELQNCVPRILSGMGLVKSAKFTGQYFQLRATLLNSPDFTLIKAFETVSFGHAGPGRMVISRNARYTEFADIATTSPQGSV
jgi:hypothetical protein